jgi:hypothetical protein
MLRYIFRSPMSSKPFCPFTITLVCTLVFACSEDKGDGGASTTTTGEPVVCEEMTCAEGQLCLWLGEYCDYDKMPPEVVRDLPMCADFPPACAGKQDWKLLDCLIDQICVDSISDSGGSYENGRLDCPTAWLDCF